MHKKKSTAAHSGYRFLVPVLLAGAMVSPLAQAISINTGNPELQINWTTEFRLGMGWRTESIAKDIGNDPTNHQSDYFARNGDMWKRRLDVLTEMDLIYRDDYGARISATGWYDNAYDDHDLKSNPDLRGISAYADGKLSRSAQRYYNGPSGEILDAFVFGTFNLGDTPISAKLGQHSLVWGVAQINSTDAISWSQQPSNLQKGAETPGASPKELAMPLPQISFQSQLNDTFSLAGYYHFDWKPNRPSEGGTFMGGPDFLYAGDGRIFAGAFPGLGNFYINQGEVIEPRDKQRGNFGVQLNMTPQWYAGTIGLVYRRFDEMQPWPVNFAVDPADPITGLRFHQVYNRGVDLFGAFTNFNWQEISWGAEVSYRRGTALDSTGGPILSGNLDGATGNTVHALLNAQAALPTLPLYDTGIVLAELGYTYLDKVTHNEQVFSQCEDAKDGPGCGTRNASSLSLVLMPTWLQVLPGVDLTGNLTVAGYGLHGNSAVLMGSAERSYAWSTGVTADINMKYKVGLLYSDAGDVEDRVGAMGSTDRGRVTLTFQTSL
ncbi:DUF1302 domain-containing protein [Pseudomonas veronii]|uniref:DUF1302 domain-containing protein n=1 Tax=Pseudomonas veronii TaxID=76761 RepID=UPI0009C30BBA|nr:DUF1302 family protein [Pseudomonas veronii]AQY65682.1 hypothetical protein PverR02_11675 [Pseudomonas veronii]